MIAVGDIKRCFCCEQEKGLGDFHRQKARTDGLNPKCKACVREYYLANREVALGRSAASRAANPDRIKSYRKATQGRDHQKNAARAKAWRAANADRVAEYRQEYLAAHPERVANSKRRDRARRRGAEGAHTADEVLALRKRSKGICAACKKKWPGKLHLDHIIAIARGGSDRISNIQLLCRPCNRAKSARDPVEFMQSMGMLL